MDFSYQLEEDSNSKSSTSEEIDQQNNNSNNDEMMGTGRSYECVFCKRGFTTAQALGGHMNIHRKDRANNNKTTTKPSSSKQADLGFYSANLARGGYYSSTGHQYHREVDSLNCHQIYFPAQYSSSDQVLCVENQGVQDLFGQDWRKRSLSLYTNPLCAHETKDKIIENNSDVDDLDLELRLGHHP